MAATSPWAILALAAALAGPAQASAVPRDDHLLVLDRRAGPYRYLESFKSGHPKAYPAAVAAFGRPSRARAEGNLCRVTWREAGVAVGFASTLRPCRAAKLARAAWYGMSLWGPRWHNRLGLRVGDSAAHVRQLYPRARLERPLGRPWLVLARRRDGELSFIRLAVALNAADRVASIEVPAGYIY